MEGAVVRKNACGGAIMITVVVIDLGTVTTAMAEILLADKCNAGSKRPGVDGGLYWLRLLGSCPPFHGNEKSNASAPIVLTLF